MAIPGTIGAFSSDGLGAIDMPPVSVCHQVSTISQFPLPITSFNQCQASWLIGSPTEPIVFNDDLSCFVVCESPC